MCYSCRLEDLSAALPRACVLHASWLQSLVLVPPQSLARTGDNAHSSTTRYALAFPSLVWHATSFISPFDSFWPLGGAALSPPV